jgi:hypothetical protein
VTLTNSGNQSLTISGISVSGDFGQTNNCGATLAPSAACQISISFVPTATGNRGGALSINDNASDSPQTVALSGPTTTGTPVGTYLLIVQVTLGSATQSTTLQLTVQ